MLNRDDANYKEVLGGLPQLQNKTKDFLDLSFLIGGQSGSGQAAQSDQVITVPYSPNYRSHAPPKRDLDSWRTEGLG